MVFTALFEPACPTCTALRVRTVHPKMKFGGSAPPLIGEIATQGPGVPHQLLPISGMISPFRLRCFLWDLRRSQNLFVHARFPRGPPVTRFTGSVQHAVGLCPTERGGGAGYWGAVSE